MIAGDTATEAREQRIVYIRCLVRLRIWFRREPDGHAFAHALHRSRNQWGQLQEDNILHIA